MAKVEALIALETAAARTLDAGWRPRAKAIAAKIQELCNAGQYDEAYRVLEGPILLGVVENSRRRLEELGIAAMIQGASQLVPAKHTSLVTGKRQLDHHVSSALDQLTVMVEEDATSYVKQAASMVIDGQTRADGKTLFSKAEMDFPDQLNAAVLGGGKGLIDIGANLTTSRLISYGFLSQAVDMDITTYQVSEVLDKRTCPVCNYMHGKTFQVKEEHGRVEQALSVMDPKELRDLAPWPKQDKASVKQLQEMDAGALQAAGFGSPPYHPGCRGVLTRSGTISELIETVQTVQMKYTPIMMRFKGKPEAPAPVVPAAVPYVFDIAEIQARIDAVQDMDKREQAQQLYAAKDYDALRALLEKAGVL